MGRCKFVSELNRLRKSSSDSIDNVESFDSFKKYMHVTRPAEIDLKSVLRSVNASGKKTLVLLCGSAGDGKSHLLSYLRNFDEEHLLENYIVYNDATESNSPSKTAIETLNELLAPFNDGNIHLDGKNIILAINLGILSNFIESVYGMSFSYLRTYVEKSCILTSQVSNNSYDASSHFQHVSFSDYHTYSLTENGAYGKYIEKILDKIFGNNEGNAFYNSYEKECANCSLSQRCPVKKNYEYLMSKKRQKYIADLLIKTIIQDKAILTTREILNFIYDIVVAQSFDITVFQGIIDDSAYLKEFMKQITPALIYDSRDVTALMNMVKKYDPLLVRSEAADEFATSYYVRSNVSKDISTAVGSVPYGEIMCNSDFLNKLNDDKTLKSQLFSLIVRIDAIESGEIEDEVYQRFLKDLYLYNSGKGKKLGALYSMIEKGVTQWCGSDLDGNLCLDNRHQGFALYESIKFTANLDHVPSPEITDELQRFTPSIKVSFEDIHGETIMLDIDYSLYTLIYKLNQGYIQTADDRNNHADFIGFVNRMLQTGSLTESITITSDDGQRANITRDTFGYKFKVVR